MPLLTVHQIWKTFRAGVAGCHAYADALRGVDLVVAEGEIVGVMGEQGSGKTTLLLCLAGLLRPDSGRIVWSAAASGTAAGPPRAEYLHGGASVENLGRRLARSSDDPPALLLLDGAFDGGGLAARGELATIVRRLVTRGSAVLVSARSRSELRGLGTRGVHLHAGRVVEMHRRGHPLRKLELVVAAPVAASRLLRAQLGGVERHGDRLDVPLHARTPEEVLAHCSALRITVNASRVVRAGLP